VNVTEHVDKVRPTGLTRLNVTEHGGHEIGTVGAIVIGTSEFVSDIEMYVVSPNNRAYVCNMTQLCTSSAKSHTLVVAYL